MRRKENHEVTKAPSKDLRRRKPQGHREKGPTFTGLFTGKVTGKVTR
jgi:hypothetical protein